MIRRQKNEVEITNLTEDIKTQTIGSMFYHHLPVIAHIVEICLH